MLLHVSISDVFVIVNWYVSIWLTETNILYEDRVEVWIKSFVEI